MPHTFQLGTQALVSHTRLTEQSARAVGMAYMHMSRNGLSEIFFSDLVAAIGGSWPGGRSAKQQLLDRAIGSGVEIAGHVLSIEHTSKQRKVYEKTKVVRMEPGSLSDLPEPAARELEAPAYDLEAEFGIGGGAAPENQERDFAVTAPANDEMAVLSKEFQNKAVAHAKETAGHRLLSAAWRKKAAGLHNRPLEGILAGELLYDDKRGATHKSLMDRLPEAVKNALDAAMAATIEEIELDMNERVEIALNDAVARGLERSKNESFDIQKKALLELSQRAEVRFSEMLLAIDARLQEFEAKSLEFRAAFVAGYTELQNVAVGFRVIGRRWPDVVDRIARLELELGSPPDLAPLPRSLKEEPETTEA